jgi:peptidyl-prolyl cis-trans isomerase D
MLLAARVVEHKPSEGLPLDQVRRDILQHLADQAATQLAQKEGREALDKLRKGEPVALSWSAAQTVTLEKRQGLHPEAAQSVFGADTGKLPAYAGVPVSQGRFAIYRITKVKDVTDTKPEQRKALAKQLTQMIGQEQYIAYLASLRERADVKVDKKKLDQGS